MSKFVVSGSIILPGGIAPLTSGYIVVDGSTIVHIGAELPAEYANVRFLLPIYK